MSAFDKFVMFTLLISCLAMSVVGSKNAGEAHRHTHELACHVGAVELCEYHEGESHE